MRIDADFAGGNIIVDKTEGDEAWLRPDLSDTAEDWFYYHFRVRGAAGKRITFHMGGLPYSYLPPIGPAVSADGRHYAFLPEKTQSDGVAFTYAFGADEEETYFAFSLPYVSERFYRFAAENGFTPFTFTTSENGRCVPALTFGKGEETIVFTCRHHCCESTASYVLEGVLSEIKALPIAEKFRIFCVPMMDIDGVENGDQGKTRLPHDHNRDYGEGSLYASVRAIKKVGETEHVRAFIDFHDPWNYGGENDEILFVYPAAKDPAIDRYGSVLEEMTKDDYFRYDTQNTIPLGTSW
ncbi:MAG TPA: hypothetical protein DDY70_00570, partial [Clostridiales bacterium]|nr:hypothetical protein [Clostridiales bacterium]